MGHAVVTALGVTENQPIQLADISNSWSETKSYIFVIQNFV
ncbi:hypothetical protein VCRA2119O147_6460001 [Vibrio crassostreae]|nr:hypothetical protein VCRA2119O147_6460001 [Vibrio crassostreae]